MRVFGSGGGRSGRLGSGRGLGGLLGLHHAAHRAGHGLTDTGTHAEAGADTGDAAFVLRGHRNGGGGLVLGEFAHVADDAHRHFAVQRFLHVFRQAHAFHGEVFQREAEFGKLRQQQFVHFLRQQHLVGGHIEEGDAGSAEGGSQLGHGEVAQLLFELLAAVGGTHAGYFAEEGGGIADAVGIHAEGAQLDHAEIGIAHGNRLGSAPAAGELLAGVEEVNVGFEGRLE